MEEDTAPAPKITAAKTEIAETGAKTEIAETSANYPALYAPEAVSTGVRVKWKAYAGAAKYRVFYKNGFDKWVKLADTTKLYYDHTAAKLDTDYTYTVRAIDKSGKYCSSFDSSGRTGRKSTAPTITKVENIAGGVKVTFKRAAKTTPAFRLSEDTAYLFVSGGTYGSGWTRIGSTSGTAVAGAIDAKNSGKTLKFALRTAYIGYTSVYSASKSAAYYATPTLKVTTVSGAHQITVNKVGGAAKYRVFLKNGSSWKKLGDTTSTLTNKNVKFGTKYIYTVRAMNSAGNYISGFLDSAFDAYYSKAPTVKVESAYYGLDVTWTGTAGSGDYYRVFRKGPNDKNWKAIAEVTGTEWYDYDVESGSTYTYTVRCFNHYNYSAAVYSVPEIVYGENSEEGITLAWTSEDSVPTYRLFVRLNDRWTAVGDTQEDYLTYTDAVEGQTYLFTVRGLNAKGKYCTSFNMDGFRITYYKDQERTFDLDQIKAQLEARFDPSDEYAPDESVVDDEDSVAWFITYTGFYGPNTGDVTNLLLSSAYKEIDSIKSKTFKPRTDDYYWKWTEENGEYLCILYTRLKPGVKISSVYRSVY